MLITTVVSSHIINGSLQEPFIILKMWSANNLAERAKRTDCRITPKIKDSTKIELWANLQNVS